MPFAPVLHSEWLKIRTLRSLYGSLAALVAVATVFAALAGTSDTAEPGFDPLLAVFLGVAPAQIAVIAFGAMAVSSEFQGGGGLRQALTAVPRRGRWFAAKAVAVALPALAAGLLTGALSVAVGTAALGDAADGISAAQLTRGVLACGGYLMLMALLATGLAAVLRSGVATLSILVPFVLIVSFVVGDAAGGAIDYLPDRAGQLAFQQHPDSSLGPWTGLAVTALWTAAALAAGAWSVRRRDA
ncbi:ABC transporter permease [Streptomyces sp. NPDC093252]|uniref:ABC transporter permease n=1 Tax=Streptomyces sp. NPDC093252 TaxID=3154980 RepID=UPI0034173CED